MTTALDSATVLPRLNAALAAGKLLVLWAELPFPPAAEAPPNAAARIAQWQQAAQTRAALPPVTWPVWEMPPLPILTLDPTPRLPEAFRAQGVPLTGIATRRDVPIAGRHSLLQLAGDLAARSGLWLAWADVRAARSDPDKAYLLQEAARSAREGVVLVLAAQPGPAFARLWDDWLAPTLHAETVYGAGADPAAWPAGISPIAGDPAAWLGQLRQPAASPRGELAPGRNLSPITPVPTLPTGPIRNRWALLVGVDAYVDPVIPNLKYCTADVLALQAALEATGYTVVALHDAAPEAHRLPTRDNVEAELRSICDIAAPDDLIWVHFSCHGKVIDGHPVLITREMRQSMLAAKALPLTEVDITMRRSPARRRVLTLDACHTGVEMGRDLTDPEFIRNAHELAEGFALLAASTSQQIAQEWAEKQHGVFTYFLLEGLRGKADRAGKGFVTVNDLTLYVLDNLRRWRVQHSGIIQEPTARAEGLGDMILADFRAR